MFILSIIYTGSWVLSLLIRTNLTVSKCNENASSVMEIDNDNEDPQLCASLACDIYNHLRMAEVNLHQIIVFSLCLN